MRERCSAGYWIEQRMTKDEALRGIHQAARKRERAAKARSEATAELRQFVQSAQDAGVSISQIAREAGLSRQGVYDLLAHQ
jgi:DNA invertase Pin-like site-specific DNA recombinase